MRNVLSRHDLQVLRSEVELAMSRDEEIFDLPTETLLALLDELEERGQEIVDLGEENETLAAQLSSGVVDENE